MNRYSTSIETSQASSPVVLVRGRALARLVCIVLGCLQLAACDPYFRRLDQFESESPRILQAFELARMEQVAESNGFDSLALPPDDAALAAGHEPGAVAHYQSPIRRDQHGSWGSCSISVAVDGPAGSVELETSAFPSWGEPALLMELRMKLAALLLESGYVAVE